MHLFPQIDTFIKKLGIVELLNEFYEGLSVIVDALPDVNKGVLGQVIDQIKGEACDAHALKEGYQFGGGVHLTTSLL